jgi:signal peptidase I
VRVKGESMMPTLWDGDYLLIRRQATVENDVIAVALIEGEVMVKRVWLMLRFRVLCDQQLNQRLKQGFASLPNIMDKLEETKIEREFLL